MKRILFTVAMILIVSVSLWANPSPFIRQYNTSFTVDLASQKFLSHKTYSTWKSGTPPDNARNNGYYYQDQELCVVGMTGVRYADANATSVIIDGKDHGKFSAQGTIKIEVELLSGEWFYSLNGTEYKRPFGLDIFCRGRLISSDGKVNKDADIAGYNLHLGNQAYSSGEAAGTFSKTIPADTVRCYDFIWWDMCLVMDPVVDASTDTVTFNGQEYPMLPSDMMYSVDLKIKISCSDGTSNEFPIHLQGVYKSASLDTSYVSIQPNLTVNTVANNLRLDGSTGLISKIGTNRKDQIATYSLSTSSFNGTKKSAANSTDSKIFIFMSSSASGLGSNGKFALHHVQDRNGVIVPQVVFNVIMESTDTNVGDGSGSYYRQLPHRYQKTLGDNPSADEGAEIAAQDASNNRIVTFTGVSYVGASTLPTVAMEVWAETTRQKVNNVYTRWNDSGNIYVKLTGTMIDTSGHEVPLDVNQLAEGQYTEDIYIHVVSTI